MRRLIYKLMYKRLTYKYERDLTAMMEVFHKSS